MKDYDDIISDEEIGKLQDRAKFSGWDRGDSSKLVLMLLDNIVRMKRLFERHGMKHLINNDWGNKDA